MKRPLRSDETRLWAAVARTVRLAPGRKAPEDPSPPPEPLLPPLVAKPAAATAPPAHRSAKAPPPPGPIEPGRHRRIARERDPIEARLDLHGFDQDRARRVLTDFVARAHADGLRAVLVITGRGLLGDGVLRRRAPEWLAEPPLRALVAGLSPAERRHGGDGALYVALKRKGRA